ncbi:hypothetical protein [Staphylococcus argensis]|uniref:Uncharacterized protein n=1 Tax=Staphylococcus argensis TaxID=1607738 RepID=A0A2K4FDY7_9STAP|nr:hypothetical protein [Staphylococcus argensis]MCY6990970.1 hypothetical protein [Staphylococcus argensis]POA09497.1 hypothetical protein CD039_01740 [Staphylococcus argensis]
MNKYPNQQSQSPRNLVAITLALTPVWLFFYYQIIDVILFKDSIVAKILAGSSGIIITGMLIAYAIAIRKKLNEEKQQNKAKK